jgi:hypothetical protein
VRADTAISGLPKIAVIAKDLKPIRKPILDEPAVQPAVQALSMGRPTSIDVVHRQENRFGFSATSASRSIVLDHGADMLSVVSLLMRPLDFSLFLCPLGERTGDISFGCALQAMIAVLEITRIHSHPVAKPAFVPAASLMVVNVEIQERAILTTLLAAAVFRAVFHTTLIPVPCSSVSASLLIVLRLWR